MCDKITSQRVFFAILNVAISLKHTRSGAREFHCARGWVRNVIHNNQCRKNIMEIAATTPAMKVRIINLIIKSKDSLGVNMIILYHLNGLSIQP
jgi:hypothetical protein